MISGGLVENPHISSGFGTSPCVAHVKLANVFSMRFFDLAEPGGVPGGVTGRLGPCGRVGTPGRRRPLGGGGGAAHVL